MYFKEDREEKESRKGKDQTNKNALKINDGVSPRCLLLEQTLHCAANSTRLQGLLILLKAAKL